MDKTSARPKRPIPTYPVASLRVINVVRVLSDPGKTAKLVFFVFRQSVWRQKYITRASPVIHQSEALWGLWRNSTFLLISFVVIVFFTAIADAGCANLEFGKVTCMSYVGVCAWSLHIYVSFWRSIKACICFFSSPLLQIISLLYPVYSIGQPFYATI